MNRVFPMLRSMAERRNVTVVPIDLRWGITDDDADEMTNNARVVDLCLREIDNSQPFFIGITGQRYGWCPQAEELETIAGRSSSKKWIKECLEYGMSITELEMQYAVWRNPRRVHAGFYIKDCHADSDDDARLEHLRQTIHHHAKRCHYPVRVFQTPQQLGQWITDDFKRLIDAIYPDEVITPLRRLQVAQQAFMASRTRCYIPVDDVFSQLDHFLKGHDSMMAVVSESGMGKSALAANWISKVMDDSRVEVVYHFVTNGKDRSHFCNVVDHLMDQICHIYQLPLPTDVGTSSFSNSEESPLNELLSSVPAEKRPLLIVIDGLNQVVGGKDNGEIKWLPRRLPSGIHLMVTTTPDKDLIRSLEKRHFHFVSLHPLQESQRVLLVNQYLSMFGKQLSRYQLERVVHRNICDNTLVLRTMLDELIAYGQYDYLNERIEYYMDASNQEDFFQRVLQRVEDDFPDLPVERILALVAFSQRGMSETELQEMAGGVRPIEWSQFYCALSNHIITQNGLIVFSHQMLYDAAVKRYSSWEKQSRAALIDRFKDKKVPRAYDELAHQYFTLHQLDHLYHLLRQYPVFEHLYTFDEHLLYSYWALMEREQSEERWNSDDYKGFYGFTDMYIPTVEQAHIFHHLGMFYEKYFVYDVDWANYYDTLSIRFFKRALEIMEAKADDDDLDTARLRLDLAFKLMHVEKYEDAQPYIEEGFSTLGKRLGDSHLELADYYCKYGHMLLEQENKRDGNREKNNDDVPYDISLPMKYYEKAAELYERNHREDHPGYAHILRLMGTAYNNIRNSEKALNCVRHALDIQQRILGDNDMQLGRTYWLLGHIYRKRASRRQEEDIIQRWGLQEKDVDLAYECYTKARQILIEALGDDHRDIITLNVIINDDIIMFYMLEAEEKYEMMKEFQCKGLPEAVTTLAFVSLHYYTKYYQLCGENSDENENVAELRDILADKL